MKIILAFILAALIYPGVCQLRQARAQGSPSDPLRLTECENLRDDALAQAGQWQNLAATLSKKNRAQQVRIDEMEKQLAEMAKRMQDGKKPGEEKK